MEACNEVLKIALLVMLNLINVSGKEFNFAEMDTVLPTYAILWITIWFSQHRGKNALILSDAVFLMLKIFKCNPPCPYSIMRKLKIFGVLRIIASSSLKSHLVKLDYFKAYLQRVHWTYNFSRKQHLSYTLSTLWSNKEQVLLEAKMMVPGLPNVSLQI